ncbi:hypothetical protein TNCT_131501 [Trichonephila clavata]|uniref:Uncharacterized protein n=1 Tax=Trichonephila clavata TaxID=2740835 RepID=A0A8X6KVC4_TRICU|nr:hypothetical protein TNCT_131501 [Trichonephila clavata]
MDMELSKSPRRTPTPPPLPPYEQLQLNKAQLSKMVTFRKHKLARIQELQAMPDHHPEDPFYSRAAAELQEIEETIQLAVSDIDSFPPCDNRAEKSQYLPTPRKYLPSNITNQKKN